MAAAAGVAGADPGTAVRLGLSMTALQASIGALNDLVDAPADARAKPTKPVPAGLVAPHQARALAGGAAVLGLVLATPGGWGLTTLAVVVLAIGYGYDLLAKGTAWSWLPFALGIPLLPVYGWYGAVAALPDWFLTLVPMAAVAGGAIAVANALVDLERDRSTGTTTVATTLGAAPSRRAVAGLWSLVALIAIGSLLPVQAPPPGAVLAVGVGVVTIAVGVAVGWADGPIRRQRGWELQAVGAAVALVGWVVAQTAG